MSKYVLALSLLLLAGAGCSADSQEINDSNMAEVDTAPVVVETTPIAETETAEAAGIEVVAVTASGKQVEVTASSVKEFTVDGDNFAFSLATMTVKKGDTVRVTFNNVEGFHDWKIDEFNVATSKLNAGGTETVEFVATEAGSFEYYCSVGSHRAMGMKGTLIVE